MNNDIKSLNKQVKILTDFVKWNLSPEYDSRERGTRAREALGAVAILEPQQSALVAAHPPFEKGSWQHAVDDQLVSFGRTSQEFDSPHDAVRWLIEQEVQLDIARADLAAQPQQAKPLSDAEIHDISAAVYCGLDREYQDFKIEFARAIEAAHGIKGQ